MPTEGPAPDKRSFAREMEQRAWDEKRPLEWFEDLYQKAHKEGLHVPWDDASVNPNVAALYEKMKDRALGSRLLVIGCGFGDDAEWLVGRGFNVTAFDIAPSAIEECRRRFPVSKVHYQVADLFASPTEWDRAFDVVLESNTVQALREPFRSRALPRIAGYVAPQGHLLLAARGRHDDEPVGTLPWPLTRVETSSLKTQGLTEVYFEDCLDAETPPVRRFRACYQRV